MLIKFFILFIYSVFMLACYNADQKLIPSQPFEPVEVEEGFNIEVNPKVDILFLIDDSGSMGPYQTDVANNISLFTAEMEKNKFLDYQIGVISSDFERNNPQTAGNLQGRPKIVSRNTPNGLKVLEQTIINVGISGSASERFFDPLHAAVDPVINLNPGFIRSDAFFVLIIVSDTYDQSNNQTGFKIYDSLVKNKADDRDKILGYSVLAYPEFFADDCVREERPPENLFDFMSLFSNAYNSRIDGGIDFLISDPLVPKRYQDLTNVFSLCDPSFGEKVARIGEDIRIRVSQKMPLPVRPVPGSIKLKYGTQEIDEKWWSYDFGSNSIILDPETEFDATQAGAKLFVVMDQADPNNTVGKPD